MSLLSKSKSSRKYSMIMSSQVKSSNLGLESESSLESNDSSPQLCLLVMLAKQCGSQLNVLYKSIEEMSVEEVK